MIGVVQILIAFGAVRLVRCGVIASEDGVRVLNQWRTTELRWDEIDLFEFGPRGMSSIRVNDGRTIAMNGIQQKNITTILNKQDTPERRMIGELNALLAEHNQRAAASRPS